MIVLMRCLFWQEMSIFFPPWKWSKGGTIRWFFAGWNPTILHVFYCFIIFSHLTRIIQPYKIDIFIHRNILAPFMYHVRQKNILLISGLLLLLFVFLSLLMMLILFLSFLCLFFYPYSIYIQECWSNVQVFHKMDFTSSTNIFHTINFRPKKFFISHKAIGFYIKAT